MFSGSQIPTAVHHLVAAASSPPCTTFRECRCAMPRATSVAVEQMAPMSGGLVCLAMPSASFVLKRPRSMASYTRHCMCQVSAACQSTVQAGRPPTLYKLDLQQLSRQDSTLSHICRAGAAIMPGSPAGRACRRTLAAARSATGQAAASSAVPPLRWHPHPDMAAAGMSLSCTEAARTNN